MAARPSLEDLLKNIPREKLNQPCRDDHLSKIALSLTDWQSIAPFLGLTKADEEEIKMDYSNTKTQKIAMLRKWKEKFGNNAKYQKLAEVFWELEQTDLVEKVCELLQTESSSPSSDEEFFDAVEEQYETNTPVAGNKDKNIPVLNLEGANLVQIVLQSDSCSFSGDEDGPSAAKRFKTNHHQSEDTVTAERNQRKALDQYGEYLKGRYRTILPTFLDGQWPPPPTRKVFNLAIIGHDTIQYGPIDEELVQLTLRGSVDDIMRRKSPIELKNLFKLDNKRRKVILIEGAPGAGKSTLAWHICQKWESGELLQQFKVVVLIQLRDPASQSANSLADLLPARSSNMRTELQSVMEACDGREVLFVLDGWDEYSPRLQHGSFIRKLIRKPEDLNMHLSAVIITSRPIASGDLQPNASSRVEIVGFTSAEVRKYFSRCIGDSETEQKFHDHLRERPVIEASCYLPLNAAIVVHLFLALNHTLPHTLHEVFLSLVICCIIRHLTRQAGGGKEIPDISSFDDLPPEVQEPFNNICAMAYHGVMKNKATFSAKDLQSFNLPTELSTLSLIQGAQSFTAFKTSISWNFLHLSVQELLGAFHVSKLPPAEQIKIFIELLDQPRLAAVFRFYAAFTKLQTEGVRDIVAKIVQKKEKPLLVHLLHGLYEAQDVTLCEFVASHLNGKLYLIGTTLSPMDCLVVGYFLSCASISKEVEVNLRGCSLDEYRVSLLVRELSKCSSFVKPLLTLNLSDNRFSHGAIVHIAEILRHNDSLKALDVSRCGVDDQAMESLASALETNGSLEVLDLSGNDALTGIGLMALGESLKESRGLKRLDLLDCGVGDQGMKSLASALEMNGSLEELNLRGNGAVTGIGLTALGESLKKSRGLKRLDLSLCGIDDQGMVSLASALEMNGSLEELDFSWNNSVTGIGLMALGESLKRNRGLKTLYLWLQGISDNDWKQFIVCLVENNHLTELQLPWSSTYELVQETEAVNQIRRQKNLPILMLNHNIL